MKKIYIILFLLFNWVGSFGQTYTISYLQLFENNKLIEKLDINEDWLIVNEGASKITLKTIHPGAQDYIFKITKKYYGLGYSKEKQTLVDDKNIVIYECEFKNNNGISAIVIEIDTFYNFIEIQSISDIKNKTGTYQKYTYSTVEN